MSNTNTLPQSVSALYTQYTIEEFVKRAMEGEVSDYIKNAYDLCKPQLGTLSLQEFAAKVSNWNPNKSGIGEKCQLQWLHDNKFPTIQKLASHGKGTVSLYREPNGKYTIIQGKKTNLAGVKSFDAIAITPTEVGLFLLKTVDIGPLTDSTGGGHQNNVQDEIVNLITHVRNQKIFIDGKLVKIYIIIDGRSADRIIQAARKAANGSADIVINESEKL